MKIQAINSNMNFKGLFTDKRAQNNGEWKMEYAPYSWERDINGKFGKANQADWNIMNDTLPDNEKIYYDNVVDRYSYNPRGEKHCTDILGTTFYYCDYDKNSLRDRITDVPAMNLEDSLRVRNKKLSIFLRDKLRKQAELESSINQSNSTIRRYSSDFYDYSRDYNKGFFERSRDKDLNKEYMADKHNDVMNGVDELNKTTQTYIQLRNSIDNLKAEINQNAHYIDILEESRLNGTLIDISQRWINDPNKALWDALQNIKTATGKMIALPHKTISVNKLIQMLGENIKKSEIADKGIQLVDRMIQHRV